MLLRFLSERRPPRARLRLALWLGADPTSPGEYALLLHNNERMIRHDIRVKRSTKDHALYRCRKVSLGYDGMGALDHFGHDRV